MLLVTIKLHDKSQFLSSLIAYLFCLVVAMYEKLRCAARKFIYIIPRMASALLGCVKGSGSIFLRPTMRFTAYALKDWGSLLSVFCKCIAKWFLAVSSCERLFSRDRSVFVEARSIATALLIPILAMFSVWGVTLTMQNVPGVSRICWLKENWASFSAFIHGLS